MNIPKEELLRYIKDTLDTSRVENIEDLIVNEEPKFRQVDMSLFKDDITTILRRRRVSDQQIAILFDRFGIGDKEMTLEEVAAKYEVSRERIRQIEATVLRALRKVDSKTYDPNAFKRDHALSDYLPHDVDTKEKPSDTGNKISSPFDHIRNGSDSPQTITVDNSESTSADSIETIEPQLFKALRDVISEENDQQPQDDWDENFAKTKRLAESAQLRQDLERNPLAGIFSKIRSMMQGLFKK